LPAATPTLAARRATKRRAGWVASGLLNVPGPAAGRLRLVGQQLCERVFEIARAVGTLHDERGVAFRDSGIIRCGRRPVVRLRQANDDVQLRFGDAERTEVVGAQLRILEHVVQISGDAAIVSR